MANPFKRQDVASPGGASDPSVPMPRFGLSSPTTGIEADVLARFPPADRYGAEVDAPEDVKSPTNKTPTVSNLGKNPFGSTVEPRLEPGPSIAGQPQAPASPLSKQKASKLMDVESFKNLLMTGNAESTGSGTTLGSTRESATLDGESSSSREPSLNFGAPVHPPGGQRILENTESSSEFSDSELDESQAAIQRKLSLKTKPPPPPKSKHGKAIQKGPQIVSFDDFAPTLEVETQQQDKPERKRASSASKPLPPTPIGLRLSTSVPQTPKVLEPPGDIPVPTNEPIPSSATKKVAPPPPVARRTTVSKRPRRDTANSMASVNEDQPTSKATSYSEPSLPHKSLPPLPPSRRTGSSSSIIFPQVATEASTSRSTLDAVVINRSRSNSQASLVSPPPPPARRRSSRTSLELTPNQRPISVTSGNASRRTSGEILRSSFDSQRVQVSSPPDHSIVEEAVEKEEKVQIAPPKVVDLDTTATHTGPRPPLEPLPSGADILADMEALQKEIDALRVKYHGQTNE
jgi:hypothetical protein